MSLIDVPNFVHIVSSYQHVSDAAKNGGLPKTVSNTIIYEPVHQVTEALYLRL